MAQGLLPPTSPDAPWQILITGRETELTTLPWVNQEARFWEPEPLRWIGIQSVYLGYRLADKSESAGGDKTSVFAKLANLLAGR